MTDANSDAPHSAQFLTDVRDLYWNADFLALVARRLRLHDVQRAVDVGSGLGHWTRTIAALLPHAHVTGVEREARWVRDAKRVERVDYVEGSADRLPFDDDSVDLVTCQTLLIHVPDPKRVLDEMRRILKPGGVLLCAEPNNTIAHLVNNIEGDVDDLLAATRLELVCERGKRALGLGFNSLGETLVGLLSDDAWTDVRAWNNDRAFLARAPYPDDARALLAQERKWFDDAAYLWPYDETKRYFVAGGGDDTQFDALWNATKRLQAAKFARVDDGTYTSAMGNIFYLIAARKR